jgi:hypothetical protein
MGYWTGDPGDPVESIHEDYGVDGNAPSPPAAERTNDEPGDTSEQQEAGLRVHDDDELYRAQQLMSDFEFDRDDGNWGIEVYIEAVVVLNSLM